MEETSKNATPSESKPEHVQAFRRVLQGTVCSDKMAKTIVVEVTQKVKHRTYKKYVRRRERYMAHDENNEYHVGDIVRIVESRPLSRHKRWRVQQLVERAK